MNITATRLPSSTRDLSPEVTEVLKNLKPGQRIRITQHVRVGVQEWSTTITGTFRDVDYLVTGLSTDRVPEDDVVVVAVHFIKDNGELSSVTLDEHSEVVASG